MKTYRYLNSASVLAIATSCALWGAAHAQEVKRDEIVVTSSPLEQSLDETIIGTSVIDSEELGRRSENSLGETLRREPGVSSSYFGPGASRPIIRGLGGNRIRVLDGGIGSIDAASSSPDHAVSVDHTTADRVEIVRGTSTLLYGSSASGGVVNVIGNRIPSELPDGGIDGSLRVGGSTVDEGFETSGGFNAELGAVGNGSLVFHVDGYYRDGDDYDIPGFAESARQRAAEEAEEDDDDDDHEEEEEIFGTVENSAYETKGGSAGLSWVFGNGFFGISATKYDSTYGLPGGHGHHGHEEEDEDHEEEEEEEEGGVTLDIDQRRLDLHGELEEDFAIFRKTKLRFGYADYEHIEKEASGEVGTTFANEGFEGRLELVQKTEQMFGGALDGALGVQVRKRDFSVIGEEAFVPPTDTMQYGLFAVEELSVDQFRFELGGRYEFTNHEVETTGAETDFSSFSFSGGIGFEPTEELFFGLTAFRTERAPSTEELFSNGPHLGTRAFEIGDPTLDKEVGRGLEATAGYSSDLFVASINGFYTSYKDFIFERATGEEEDELDVFQFVAEDVDFRGFEAQVEAELFQVGMFGIHGDASVDYVRATSDVAGNQNLPRIPPLSGLVGLELKSDCVDLRGEFEFATEQDKVGDFELPTDGYEVFNAFLSVRPFANARGVAFNVSGHNLSDEEVRLHTSFLKDLVPLPGRNVKFSVAGRF